MRRGRDAKGRDVNERGAEGELEGEGCEGEGCRGKEEGCGGTRWPRTEAEMPKGRPQKPAPERETCCGATPGPKVRAGVWGGKGGVSEGWEGGERCWRGWGLCTAPGWGEKEPGKLEGRGEKSPQPNPLLPLQLRLEEKLASGSFFKTHLVGRVKIKSRVSVGLGFPLSLPRAGSGSLGLLQLFGRRLGG